mgnify:CR=1 FL=1
MYIKANNKEDIFYNIIILIKNYLIILPYEIAA